MSTNTSTSATSSIPKAPLQKFATLSFVDHINVLLFLVVLAFAVYNIPRVIVRFTRRSEWFQGILLHSSVLTRKPNININTSANYPHSDPQTIALVPDNDKKVNPTIAPLPASAQRAWHMPMLSSLIHPVAGFLRTRVHEYYSVGQVLLMAGYSAVIVYAGLYRSNPFSDLNRSGWVSTCQLPFVYILATKNNVIGMLVGSGYEKLNYLHRLAGRLAVLAANVHAIGYIYQWTLDGDLSVHMAEPTIKWAFVALVCFDIMGLFSVQFVRSKFYHFFFVTHVVASFFLLISVWGHFHDSLRYVIVAGIFYGLDYLIRTIKTRAAIATLRPVPELGLTRVEVPSINAGWHAGQHVRVRILSTAMGAWTMTEVHPLTIASANKTEDGLVLLCQKVGRWSTKLYDIANSSVRGERGQELGRSIKLIVEGPYGSVGDTVIPSYSGVMIIAGGSGVSFALSVVQELVRLSGISSNVTDIDIIWSIAVNDPASLTTMIPHFTALISECTTARLHISIYYTRAPTKPPDGTRLSPGITLTAGRPNISRHLGDLVHSMLDGSGCRGSGLFVGVCGPGSLAESVSEAVKTFNPTSKKAVGGIELYEEVFGL